MSGISVSLSRNSTEQIEDLVRAAHEAVLRYASNGASNDPKHLRSYLARHAGEYWGNDTCAWRIARRLVPYALRYGEEMRRTRAPTAKPEEMVAAVTAYLLLKHLYSDLRSESVLPAYRRQLSLSAMVLEGATDCTNRRRHAGL
jgi:hypothetical protein